MTDNARQRSDNAQATYRVELRSSISDLYAEYAACLDEGRFNDWPEFFTEDCHYKVIPRENHQRGLPLATMDLQSRNALMDRVYGVQSTLWHAPYYQRHIIGPSRITILDETAIHAETNYLIIRTKRDVLSEVFNAGRYLDRIVNTSNGLRFAQKTCVFDSELIPNSMIYPI